MPKTFYNEDEAAAEFGIHPQQMAEYRKAHKVGFTLMGRRVVYSHEELVRFFKSLPTGPKKP